MRPGRAALVVIIASCNVAAAFPPLRPLCHVPRRSATAREWVVHPTGYASPEEDVGDNGAWPAWEVALVQRHATFLKRIQAAEARVRRWSAMRLPENAPDDTF